MIYKVVIVFGFAILTHIILASWIIMVNRNVLLRTIKDPLHIVMPEPYTTYTFWKSTLKELNHRSAKISLEFNHFLHYSHLFILTFISTINSPKQI